MVALICIIYIYIYINQSLAVVHTFSETWSCVFRTPHSDLLSMHKLQGLNSSQRGR